MLKIEIPKPIHSTDVPSDMTSIRGFIRIKNNFAGWIHSKCGASFNLPEGYPQHIVCPTCGKIVSIEDGTLTKVDHLFSFPLCGPLSISIRRALSQLRQEEIDLKSRRIQARKIQEKQTKAEIEKERNKINLEYSFDKYLFEYNFDKYNPIPIIKWG